MRTGDTAWNELARHTFHLAGAPPHELATITCSTGNRLCRILLDFRHLVIDESASDFFEAFCRVRMELEKLGFTPLVNGASLDVYPSAMGRDMGLGLKAYRISLGKPAGLDDLVHIFEESPEVVPATVAQQKEYWLKWLKDPKQ